MHFILSENILEFISSELFNKNHKNESWIFFTTKLTYTYGRILTPKLHLAFLRYIVLSSLYILHSDFHILHSDLYILHSDLYILHSDLYMLLSYMHIMLSAVCVFLNCILISLFNDQILFIC
jgi:hypothetical protein